MLALLCVWKGDFAVPMYCRPWFLRLTSHLLLRSLGGHGGVDLFFCSCYSAVCAVQNFITRPFVFVHACVCPCVRVVLGARQVDVFFILAKGYLSHELGMLGFPA